MYSVGVLFGLGFDTATEVGLLAITAGAATGHIPPLAIVALPTLFAAGMAVMDTADGVFMTKAYRWAFASPARKLYYNVVVTSLSVCVALLVGTIIGAGGSVVLFVGVRHVQRGTITLGELLLVMGYLTMLYTPIKMMARKAGSLQEHLANVHAA